MRKGCGDSTSLEVTPPISTCPPTWKLSKLHLFGFLWRLYYTGMAEQVIGHLVLNSICRFFPLSWEVGVGGGDVSSNPPITGSHYKVLAPLTTNLTLFNFFLGEHFRSHFINITKDTFCCSHHLGNPKGFRSFMPETGMKTKYIFIIKHNVIVYINIKTKC